MSNDSGAYVNKHDCLARAKSLIASGDVAALRYACLELRMCIEAVTYDKLSAYASRLPQGILARWQPPKAVAALIELEDNAGKEYRVAFGVERNGERGPLQFLGEHRTFDPEWLRKNYSKLGAFLHATNQNDPKAASRAADLKPYLEEVVAECERVVASSVMSTMAPLVEFTCQLCRRKSAVNASGAERKQLTACLHPGCEAEHAVTREDDGLHFGLKGVTFACQSCGDETLVPTKQLAPAHIFSCEKCGRRHKLIDTVWRYAAEVVETASEVT